MTQEQPKELSPQEKKVDAKEKIHEDMENYKKTKEAVEAAKVEEKNQAGQAKIDGEIEQITNEMDTATINFVQKITRE